MARAPDQRVEQAKELFLNGKKLIEISEDLKIPEGTVRSWKNRYGWGKNGNATLRKKKCNVAKENSIEKKAVAKAVEQVIDNPDLTDKQRLFCVLYARSFNATKAYQKAYGVDYATACSIGYRLLEKDGIRAEINRLKQNRLNREMLEEHDIFQKYMDIAFSDITDYVSFGRERVPVMGAFGPVEIKDPETGEKVLMMQEVNSMRFRESTEVDGTLITEIKQGKNGTSIKLADRLKALQWLSDHMDLATEEQKVRMASMKARMGESEDTELPEDGFLEALQGTAAEDWKEAEADNEEETNI